jgi:hypothetical protein
VFVYRGPAGGWGKHEFTPVGGGRAVCLFPDEVTQADPACPRSPGSPCPPGGCAAREPGSQQREGGVTSAEPPGGPGAVARLGPWTFRTCVTAACTRCGAAPLDDGTGLTPHFASPGQAAGELVRDWGWLLVARPGQWDELLCPPCCDKLRAGRLPANARVYQPARRPQQEKD